MRVNRAILPNGLATMPGKNVKGLEIRTGAGGMPSVANHFQVTMMRASGKTGKNFTATGMNAKTQTNSENVSLLGQTFILVASAAF